MPDIGLTITDYYYIYDDAVDSKGNDVDDDDDEDDDDYDDDDSSGIKAV